MKKLIFLIIAIEIIVVLGCAPTSPQFKAEMLCRKGMSCVEKGDFYAALDIFNNALKYNINSISAYSCRAFVHAWLGNYDYAFNDANKAISIDRNSYLGYSAMGAIYEMMLDIENAIYWQSESCKRGGIEACDAVERLNGYLNNPNELNKLKETIREVRKALGIYVE